jgi:hypothetical protein
MSRRFEPIAYAFEVKASTFDSEPHLPSKVLFVSRKAPADKALRNHALEIESVSASLLGRWKQQLRRIQDGELQAEYTVREGTNWGGFYLPVRFDLTVMQRFENLVVVTTNEATLKRVIHTIPATNMPNAQFVGTLQALEFKQAPLAWPSARHMVSVADRRFRSERQGIDHIKYNVTNEWILNTNDARLVRLFTEKRKAAPFLRAETRRELVVILSFGLLLLGPPLVFWLKKRWLANSANP